jgi:hypothetical protein
VLILARWVAWVWASLVAPQLVLRAWASLVAPQLVLRAWAPSPWVEQGWAASL